MRIPNSSKALRNDNSECCWMTVVKNSERQISTFRTNSLRTKLCIILCTTCLRACWQIYLLFEQSACISNILFLGSVLPVYSVLLSECRALQWPSLHGDGGNRPPSACGVWFRSMTGPARRVRSVHGSVHAAERPRCMQWLPWMKVKKQRDSTTFIMFEPTAYFWFPRSS